MIFPEGLQSEDEFAAVADALRGYGGSGGGGGAAAAREGRALAPCGGPFLLANMTEFGVSPLIPAARLGEMGYHCAIFPVSVMRVMLAAATRVLGQIQRDGAVGSAEAEMMTRKEFYELLGYAPGREWPFPATATTAAATTTTGNTGGCDE